MGAFGKYENANRLNKQIQSNGYGAEVHAVNSNGKRLHAVRIVRYASKKDAEKNIMFDCKKFLGELGIGKAGITFMKFDKKYQLGIIRTNITSLDET